MDIFLNQLIQFYSSNVTNLHDCIRGAPDPELLDPAGSGSVPDPDMLDPAGSGSKGFGSGRNRIRIQIPAWLLT